MKNTIFLLFISFFIGPIYGQACTSFYIKHETIPVHGANFDWHDGEGYIIINKRGYKKKAL